MATTSNNPKPGQPPRPGQPAEPSKRQDAQGNKIVNPEEELALIEREIHELKIAFEQYFIGVDRHSPTRRRDALAGRIRKLKEGGSMRNTTLRFRLEQLSSKFGAYDRMWARQIYEMESGTSRRDHFRLKQRAKAAEAPPPAPTLKDRPTAPSAAPTPSTLSDGQVRALYDAFVTAKQRTNESTDGLTYDALARNLRKQVPELLTKYEAKAIDFKVVIKNGRAMLKAVPRK